MNFGRKGLTRVCHSIQKQPRKENYKKMFSPELLGIIGLTLRMTLISTFISALIGIPLGFVLEKAVFPGKQIVVMINRTLMGLPPVVAGLIVYILLRRAGPFGSFGLLFTLEAMIIAQVLLITPIICGMVYTATCREGDKIRSFAFTMGASRLQTTVLLIKELKNEIFFFLVAGFGRAMSEVGAIMMVGGNIRFHTRTMTTAIALEARRGQFEEAIVLGALLMLIAVIVQVIGSVLRRKEQRLDENF